MTKFTASGITVLRFSKKADRQGIVCPPDCHAVLPDRAIPVTFNHNHEQVIGSALIRRKGNKLIADLEVTSKMDNTVEALRLMRMLRPSIELMVLDAHEETIMGIRVTGLALIGGDNADPKIEPLGDSLRCATPGTKAGLH